MLKGELSGGGSLTWARVCDTCRSAPCRVYCRVDAAYLCTGCDARLHAPASGHERVWVCEACERAPAAFVCKADAASLCADCDAKIHSANPLARRHQRFPVSGCLYGHSAANPGRKTLALAETVGESEGRCDEGDEDEAASWIVLNPSSTNNTNENINNNNNNTNGCSLGGEVMDEYLDLVEFDLGGSSTRLNEESVYNHHNIPPSHQYTVPIGAGEGCEGMDGHHTFQMGLDHYAYNSTLSIGQSVSVSSLEVGIVPDNTTSDFSTSQGRQSKGAREIFSNHSLQQMPTQLSPMDREARVLRYREKKKTRKFEKTIRYASRKAYAETRPRVKGRFAKRTNIETEVEQMFPNSILADTGYGIVPSF